MVLHLNHRERWNWSTWEALGQRFVTEIKPLATDKTYRQQLENAIDHRTGRSLSDLKYNLGIACQKMSEERHVECSIVYPARICYFWTKSLLQRLWQSAGADYGCN